MMSSALKPALPPAGGQTSPGSAPAPKSMSGAQGPMPGGGGPGSYGQALGHMPAQALAAAGLPHAHGNMGLPSANSTANMSSNAVPNMSGMGGGGGAGSGGASGHPSVVVGQSAAHGAHASPAKGTALPPAAAAGVGRPPVAHPPYMSPPGAVPHPRDDEGTALPASQNSAQLMAVHRAQQQHHHQQIQPHHPQQHLPPSQTQSQQQHDHPSQQPQQQQQMNMADRFKQQQSLSLVQQPPPAQPQANGTASGPNEPVCHKTSVPAPPTIGGDAKPDVPSGMHNHVPVGHETTDSSSSAPTASPTQLPEPKHATSTSAGPPADDIIHHAPTTKLMPVGSSVRDVPKVQSTMKLATTPRTNRKQRDMKPVKRSDSPKAAALLKTPDNKQQISAGMQKSGSGDGGKAKGARASDDERKSKRTRTRTQPYQSPLPELALISKLSGSTPARPHDEKLIVFYKNEFLAVRNAEGGFYVCQAVQNVYKSSPRIRIRWLSQDKQDKIYIPDFYDFTDFDCILTNLNMERVEKGKYNLPKDELERTENILKRALAVESGASAPSLTEEHPDGLDLSLFRDESQLKKKRKSKKRKSNIPLASTNTNSKMKKTPDKAKVRRVSKSPAKSARRNNQSSERRSTSTGLSNDKREMPSRTPPASLRRSDGGRAERAKRRGESSHGTNAASSVAPSAPKTSPVVDQKKARVLAKVALKTAISATTAQTTAHNKKKAAARSSSSGATKSAASAVVAAAAAATRAGIKAATRSQGSASGTTSALAAAVAAAAAAATASTTPSTRRAKKGRK